MSFCSTYPDTRAKVVWSLGKPCGMCKATQALKGEHALQVITDDCLSHTDQRGAFDISCIQAR
jgi:hypothetical protein